MASYYNNYKCNLCPNKCNAARAEGFLGKCGVDDNIYVAHRGLHNWEEPVISGTKGSGAVFFSGCTMRCVFCQNYLISRKINGKKYSVEELAALFSELDKTAENINLVSPTPYANKIIEALKIYRPKTVVWNSSGYETVETLKALKGFVDIYLPDLKYVSGELSQKYSGTKNYYEFALPAIKEMIEQVGSPKVENGLMKSGVIIRHLVLPDNINNSLEVLKVFADNFKDTALLSVMAQYVPLNVEHMPEINRRLKPIEYKRVLNEIDNLGITNGFVQELSAATSDFIPDFNSIVK